MSRRRPTILALPAGVRFDQLDFQPTWQEIEWERWLRAKAEYEKTWLENAQKELAILACIVERDARETALEEWHLRREKFHLEQAAKQDAEDQRQILAYLAAQQKALDAPAYNAMLARVQKAGADIRRQNDEIEMAELKRRDVRWRRR